MQIHLINLDRSDDRLREFEKSNPHLSQSISRRSAIDGKSVSRAQLVDQGIIEADLAYNDGALGNALSHLALWNLAIERHEALTVCEDDAIFNGNFAPAADFLMKSLPLDWHMIFWGWNFDSILWFDMIPGVSTCVSMFEQEKMRGGVTEFQAASFTPQPFKLLQEFGSVCYSISPTGARMVREFCLPLRNMAIHFPGLGRTLPNLDLGIMVNAVFPKINAFVSVPPLVITKNDHGISTVQKTS